MITIDVPRKEQQVLQRCWNCNNGSIYYTMDYILYSL